MVSNLSWFEKLIETELREIANTNPPAEITEYHKERIANELRSLKKDIFKAVTANGRSKSATKAYVRYNQKLLVRLMDILYEQHPEFWKLKGVEDSIRMATFKALRELRVFLEDYFHQFYDQREKQSKIDAELLRQEMTTALLVLRSRFLPYHNEPFFLALTSPLTGYLNKQPRNISCAAAGYLSRYKNHILRMEVGTDKFQVLERCRKSLFRYNVNSPRVFGFLTDQIQSKLGAQPCIRSKIQLLNGEALNITRAYSKPGIFYRSDLPALKEMIAAWIYAEIEFWQKELAFQESVREPQSPMAKRVGHPKLSTNLSVPEIALLLRLGTESGMISGNSITDTLRWGATNLESSKRKSISKDSLRRKYYDLPTSSLAKIEGYLEKMKKIIRRMD